MDSTSSRVPGSDENNGNSGEEKKAERSSARVIRASKPLPRPAKSDQPEPPKAPPKPTGPLKPGDRLWSKPKKQPVSYRNPRLVYLSTKEYEVDQPPVPEAPPPPKTTRDARPRHEAPAKGKAFKERAASTPSGRPSNKAPRSARQAPPSKEHPKKAGERFARAQRPAAPKPPVKASIAPVAAPVKPGAKEVHPIRNLRATAAKILQTILEKKQPLKTLLQTEQDKLSFEADRALLREMTAGVLRRLPHIDWCIDEAAKRGLENIQPEITALLRVGVYQILFLERVPIYAAVDQCVEAAKILGPPAAGFVNGILRSVAEKKEFFLEAPYRFAGSEGKAMRFGMPAWLAQRYEQRFGEKEAELLMQALQEPPATTIVFANRAAATEGESILSKAGFALGADPDFDLVRIAEGGNPASSEAFKRGLFYICDPASLVPALLLPAKPGTTALDLCAAPGTKTVILSGRVENSGRVVSCDVNARRLRQIRQNTLRLRLENVTLLQANAEQPLPFRRPFSSVLLDAPCSSLGTLRRNPEIRWQIQPGAFSALQQRQLQFLNRAAEAVAPSGHLLYSVCSIEEEETTQVAGQFLEAHPDFKAEPLSVPDFLAPLLEPAGKGQAYCLPNRRKWDGFFVALFKRVNKLKD